MLHRHAAFKQRGKVRPGLADGVGGFDPGQFSLALAQTWHFGEPAENPVDVVEGCQRRCGGCGVGALAVVHVGDTGKFGDPLHAVRET